MVIKALSAEPCDDCISRFELKRRLQEHHDFFVNAYGGFSNLPPNDKARVDEITNCIAEVMNMPSVQPKEIYNKGWQNGQDALAFHLELCKEEAEPRNTCDKGSADMLRRTNYGLWVDDDGKSNKNELAIDYIVESARSVGIEVIDGKTALDIQFMAEVMKRLREKQEPCEDCINRQAVLGCLTATKLKGLKKFDLILHTREEIKKLPPVTPEPKTDVLNKIRAEIKEVQTYKMFEGEDTVYVERNDVLAIIDKYKAESEE